MSHSPGKVGSPLRKRRTREGRTGEPFMKRLPWMMVGLGLVAVLLTARQAAAAPAPSQKTPLGQLPASAPIVVHLRGLEGTKDRLIALMKKTVPDLVPMVQPKLEEWLKDG